jgi:hypothetical protein
MAEGIKFFFRMRGLEEIEERLAVLRKADAIKRQAATQLFRDASAIMTVSQTLCPVDTGTLRSTGHVQIPVIHGDIVTVLFGYGGPAAPYAVPVHENLRARHVNGTAKYLEIPYLEYQQGGLQHFADELAASGAVGLSLRGLGRAMAA